MTDCPRIDRREFAKGLITASSLTAAVTAATLISAADDKPAGEPKDASQPDNAPPAAPPSEELLLLNCLMQRYPSEHFDQAAIRGIYGDLRADVARGRILSEFPLKNSDEPSFVFRVYRSTE